MLKLRLLVSELRLKQLTASVPFKNFAKVQSKKGQSSEKEKNSSPRQISSEMKPKRIATGKTLMPKRLTPATRPSSQKPDLSAFRRGEMISDFYL